MHPQQCSAVLHTLPLCYQQPLVCTTVKLSLVHLAVSHALSAITSSLHDPALRVGLVCWPAHQACVTLAPIWPTCCAAIQPRARVVGVCHTTVGTTKLTKARGGGGGKEEGCNWSGVDPPLSLQPRLPHGLHCHVSSLCALWAIGLVCGPKGPNPYLSGWGQGCGLMGSGLPPGHLVHWRLSLGRGVFPVFHVWGRLYFGRARLRGPLLARRGGGGGLLRCTAVLM